MGTLNGDGALDRYWSSTAGSIRGRGLTLNSSNAFMNDNKRDAVYHWVVSRIKTFGFCILYT
jgi:hypothetical protein